MVSGFWFQVDRHSTPLHLVPRHSLTGLRKGGAPGVRHELKPALLTLLCVASSNGGGTSLIIGFLPEAKAAQKGIGVVAITATLGQLLQFFYVAAAENDIVGFEGRD